MKTVEKPTYISLFSSAGIGCYGFKLEGFDCVATNELITRRLEVQKFNKKCKYESGYICGDITKDATKNALYDQIALWKKREGLSRIDVVIATPPCQGYSSLKPILKKFLLIVGYILRSRSFLNCKLKSHMIRLSVLFQHL